MSARSLGSVSAVHATRTPLEPSTDAHLRDGEAGGVLVDTHGRVATDLRVSITDRCDLRCTYCMPEEGLDWLDRAELLTPEEIAALCEVLMGLGIRTLRVTGGEPLVRPGVEGIIARLASLGPEDLSLTTNGTQLQRHAARLARAGLDRVNVSIDSLVSHRYARITRRDALARVLAGVEAAGRAGLVPVKVNCVVVAGTNDDEIVDFVEFARRTGCEVRFIENMPLGADGSWRPDGVVPASEVLARIRARYDLAPRRRGTAPAAAYDFADGSPGGVGVIASVTEPFCGTCDRLRLTADGFLRTCLFAHEETDLRTPLRDGAGPAELGRLVTAAVAAKGPGHLIGRRGFEQPVRVMSRIGG